MESIAPLVHIVGPFVYDNMVAVAADTSSDLRIMSL